MEIIYAWTDGGARNNQSGSNDSVGGYGVILQYKGRQREIWGGERGTTNNQQEMKAVVRALEYVKTTDVPVVIYSDSAYTINGITQWVEGWKKNGWKKKGGEIKNLELWKRMDELVSVQSDVKFIKVKGHSDNAGNNRADELANLGMDGVIENERRGLQGAFEKTRLI